MGDTTNTAARITAKAPVGQIYAHPSVLDQSMAVFEVEPSPPLTMKGKKVPLVAYRIGTQIGTRRREGLEVAEFFGRATELEAICARLDGLAAGHGAVVCISGDTGMGKSKLITEALARAGRPPLLALRGEPNTGSSAYALFRDALRQLFGIAALEPDQHPAALTAFIERAAPELAPFAPLIGDVAGVTLPQTPETAAIDPQFRPTRTADALLRLLELDFPGPRAWVVDDAQWSDESSATILAALAERCATQPWLLLVARRPGDGGFAPDRALPEGADLTRLEIGPLANADLARVLTVATEAAPLRPHELDLLIARAGGNPLFALELLRAARDAGSFDAVPESLEAAMAAQVDALDPEARRLLRYASVLGRSFARDVLAEALRAEGHAPDDATLERLQDFLEPEGADRLRFRSDVICDTTYQAVSYQLRKRLHLRVGESMARLAADADAIADALATHFARADDHARAFRFARIAAEQARSRFANAEAARYYGLALESARQLADVSAEARIELLTRLGEVRERAGLLEDSLEAYAQALKLAGDDPVMRADLLYARATAKERMRAFSGALRDLRAGLRLLAQDPSARAAGLRARLETTLAWIFYGQDRPARALRQAQRAAAEARSAGERSSLGAALMIRELASLMAEGPGTGGYLEEALAIFEELGDLRMQASVKANLGFICAVAGRWQQGTAWFDAARDTFSRIGDIVRSTDPALNLGEMLVKQRRYEEAEPVLRDAIRVLRAAHFVEGMNRGEIQLARILIERGEVAQAEQMLARVQNEFGAAGQPLAALEAACIRAFGRLRAGAAAEALALLDDARSAAGPDANLLLPAVACERARILGRLGRLEEARADISAGLEAARSQGLPYEEAMLLQVDAEIAAKAGIDAGSAAAAAQQILNSLGVR
jgi:hypothetical protein